ncbi:MAG: hypothetical protein K9N34_08210 [Candidatus Marinimicrobia bacterium]|nr:hypothetical protein [Candidatus Neomarinimicrobiota bacterium]
MGKFLQYLKRSTREMILVVLVFLIALTIFFKIAPQFQSPPGTYPLKVLELPVVRDSVNWTEWPNPRLTYQGVDTMALFTILEQPAGLPNMALIHFYSPGYRDSTAVHAVWDLWQKKGMRRIEVALTDTIRDPVWQFADVEERGKLTTFFTSMQRGKPIADFTLFYLNRYPDRIYFTAGPMDTKSVNLYLTREYRGRF